MTVAATSRQVYERVDLQAQEETLLREIRRYFQRGKFTRRELAMRTGWETATISARVNGLLKKGLLIEHQQTRDGGHLLSIAQPKTAPQLPHGVCRADDPNEEAKGIASSRSRPQAAGAGATDPKARGVAPSVSDDRAGTSIAAGAALIESIDSKGRPFRYYAEGYGPGWPPDQDAARRARR
jgi:hypothetical protein